MCQIHDAQATTTPAFDASALVDELVVALSNARIYRPDHPRVSGAAASLVAALEGWFQARRVDEIEIGTTDGFLFHAGKPLVGASLSAGRLIGPLTALGSGGLLFRRGAATQDVQALVALLGARTLEPSTLEEANAALAQVGARHVQLLPPYRAESLAVGAGGGASGEEVDAQVAQLLEATPRAAYQGTVELLQDTAIGAARGDTLGLDSARSVVERLQQRMQADALSMLGASRYERYDEFTFGHSIRVCLLALQFASTLTHDPLMLNRIGLAALLHDIGKARVPFDLLHARRRLDAAERVQIGLHTELGAEILLENEDPDLLSVAVAFGHHRAPDGSGYPRSADGAQLGLATRIIRICDVYEALTAVRPYKDRMSPTRAYRVMMGMVGHFDPPLLRRFIRHNGVLPIGCRVLLASGERAQVKCQTHDVLRPIVRVQGAGQGGSAVAPERDLSELRDDEGWRVERLLLDGEAA